MEVDLRLILIEWGMPQTVLDKFEQNDITSLDHLKEMELEDVEEYLTKGQKIIFRKKLNQYKLDNSQVIFEVLHQRPESSIGANSSNDISTAENKASQESSEEIDPVELLNQIMFPMTKKTPPRSSPRLSNEAGPSHAIESHSVVRNLFSSSRSSTINFREFLESSFVGAGIIEDYQKNGRLSKESSKRLVRLIVLNEMQGNQERKIPTSKFVALAHLIKQQFPSEDELEWFSPFVVSGKKRICASGRLYTFYNNERKHLRQVGQIQSKKNSSSTDKVVADSVKNSLNWLKNSGEPFDTALAHWIHTYEERKALLANETPLSYFQKFRCLKGKLGYKFLESDYNSLQPGTEDLFFDNWPELRSKIIRYHKRKAENDANHKALLSDLKLWDVPDEDENLFTINVFKLLTLSVLPKSIQGPKKSWKPTSKLEVLNYSFAETKTFADLENLVQEKINAFADFELAVQPFPAIVIEDNLPTSYVCINQCFYKVQSPISAIDITFKICHALQAEFPHECKYTYLFLQHYAYKFVTKLDGPCATLKNFVKDLRDSESSQGYPITDLTL